MKELLEVISGIMAADLMSDLRFEPVIAGSVAEGTKVYLPNELDFMCGLQTDIFTPYQSVDTLIGYKLDAANDLSELILSERDESDLGNDTANCVCLNSH